MTSVTLKDETFKEVIDVCYLIALSLLDRDVSHYTRVLGEKITRNEVYLSYDLTDESFHEESIGINTLCLTDSDGYALCPWSHGDLPDRISSLHRLLMGEIGDVLRKRAGSDVFLKMTESQKQYAEATFIPLYHAVIL